MIFFSFFGVLCSVLRISSESDPSHRDRSVSVPAESAAETETLNHGLEHVGSVSKYELGIWNKLGSDQIWVYIRKKRSLL